MGPCDLQEIFSSIKQSDDDRLVVGFDSSDDGAVYLASPNMAIVQTADFITPVVDDPYIYGQIASANSLSDIFAMGASVATALNLVLFDSCHFGKDVMREILRGGESKIKEAGGMLVGGHTIEDVEMKYGLSVMGIAHPNDIKRNNTALISNDVILTKPLGSGILTTAIKADMLSKNSINEVSKSMATLNMIASQIALKYNATALTDVTGFGFLGHLSEMLNQNISFEIDSSQINIFSEALEYASMGIIPAGSYRNRDFLIDKINIKNISEELKMVLFDAQTSGGLLICVDKKYSKSLLDELYKSGITDAKIIGSTVPKKEYGIYVE